MLCYWIFRSSVLCSTSRACPCARPEKKVGRQCLIFCAREARRFRQQSCVLLCKKIRMNNDHKAHRSMIKRLDIIEPHVTVLCAPRSGWVILREDCPARRASFGSKSNRSVPRSELQVERQLVCTRNVRSRSNVHPKMSCIALSLRFCEEQNQYCRSKRRHLEFVFPLSNFMQWH